VTSEVISIGAMATVASLAATPFVEIIGAVPVALALHMRPLEAALWSVIGNTILIVVLLALLEPLERVVWVQNFRRYLRLPPTARRLLERYGLPVVAIFGPLIGMFIMLPAARVLGFQRRYLAVAAITGSVVFSTLYASALAWLVRF
jgi:Ca2+/H+ antiporter, TMEM165/GDT1 family